MGRRIIFPPVETANEDGLVAVGGDFEIDTIITAYKSGIFPWPLSSYPLNLNMPNTWFAPNPRGLLEFKNLHVSTSFKKFLRKEVFEIRFNTSFEEVIENCAAMKRKDQPGTWITPSLKEAYIKLYHAGFAYSAEAWNGDQLVGGLYGVNIGSFFSGESMFTLEDNAGKTALFGLIMRLQDRGVHWLDTQMVTEVVKQFGGKYLPRPTFMKLLGEVDWTKQRSDYL